MRLEYKFLVHCDYLDNLRADMMPFMEVDRHAQEGQVREYTVRSIYFDTLEMEYYREKVDGIRVRKKVRVRGYNLAMDDSVVFLELKRKFENHISKVRSSCYFRHLSALIDSNNVERYVLNGNNHIDSHNNAKRFLFHVNRRALRPVVLVVYEREAFFCKFNQNLRVTFDKKLRSKALPATEALYSDTDMVHALPNYFVLEIKFRDGFPKWLQSINESYGLIRSAVSKYAICVDSHKLARPSQLRSAMLV